MGKSLLLMIDELVQGQVQAFQTVNDAVAALEESENADITITTATDYTLAELDLVRYNIFTFTGMTADRTVTIPSTVNTVATQRKVWIINDSAFALTLTTGTGAVEHTLQPGMGGIFHIKGASNAVRALLNTEYLSIAAWKSTVPTHDEEILRYIVAEPFGITSTLEGSQVDVATNPIRPTQLWLYKNATRFGHIDFDITGAATITSANTDFIAGDVLSVNVELLQEATVTFNAVPDSGDAIGISDGVTTVTFTFGSLTGQIAPGADVTAAATNLKTAIDASALNANLIVRTVAGVVYILNTRKQNDGNIAQLESGTVDFTAVADVADTITINDGATSDTFSFVASGGTGLNVNRGATATDSATNLKTAIDARGPLDVTVFRNGATLTIVNNRLGGGGSMTKSDADNDYTITAFAIDADNDIDFTAFASDTVGKQYALTLKGTKI